jgi:release factor glutamine methyltransferase
MSVRRSADSVSLPATRAGAALTVAAEQLAAASATPRLDAEVLLALAAGRTRASLLAFPERTLDPAAAVRFAALLARRATGEPLAYLTGEREFFSLPLAVSPDVLIPRAETELLVELALDALAALPRPAVLDLGTGSGAIALAIKSARAGAVVTGSDSSGAALKLARANAARLGLDVQWVESRWFDALGAQRFDAIVSNPPYVPSADVRGALGYEPRLALDGGADGLDAYRELLAAAGGHLTPSGVLLLEHGHDQRAALGALAVALGWRVAALHDDLAGRPRVLLLARGTA